MVISIPGKSHSYSASQTWPLVVFLLKFPLFHQNKVSEARTFHKPTPQAVSQPSYRIWQIAALSAHLHMLFSIELDSNRLIFSMHWGGGHISKNTQTHTTSLRCLIGIAKWLGLLIPFKIRLENPIRFRWIGMFNLKTCF